MTAFAFWLGLLALLSIGALGFLIALFIAAGGHDWPDDLMGA